ncbi:MAG TPA: hypothetical protein VGO47_09220 [Chlamydiales bacterium]|nr:hypothetical protein [Chlamydiales bacterium]
MIRHLTHREGIHHFSSFLLWRAALADNGGMEDQYPSKSDSEEGHSENELDGTEELTCQW